MDIGFKLLKHGSHYHGSDYDMGPFVKLSHFCNSKLGLNYSVDWGFDECSYIFFVI